MIPTLLFCLSISFTHLEGNNKTGKTKAAAFSNYDNKASKYIFAFLRVSFSVEEILNRPSQIRNVIRSLSPLPK